MHESGSFCFPKRAETVVPHSPNIPYALAFKPLRILPLPSHLPSPPPPPPDLCCWSSSILIENSSPCVLFQFGSCLRRQSETLLWLKLMEVKNKLPHTFTSFSPVYLQLSSLGSAQSKPSHQKAIHFLLAGGSWFTLKLHNPSTWCKEESRDTRGSGDTEPERPPSLVAAHSPTRWSAERSALGEEHVDRGLSTGENTRL